MVNHGESVSESTLKASAVRVPKTAELIAATIRQRVVSGELRVGDTLPPETELMNQFEVSRPTLREAFRILESESLITIRRGARGGARITMPDTQAAARSTATILQLYGTTLDDLFDARILVEPPAAGMAARGATKATIDALRRSHEAESAAAEQKDSAAYAVASTKFHEEVLRVSGNITVSVLGNILSEILESRATATARGNSDGHDLDAMSAKALRSHARLLQFIEDRDSENAEALWRRHLTATKKYLVSKHGPISLVELLGAN